MSKYVALLRGINVGGGRKVSMSELKELFESLNFKNVSTYINSGNVIFESSSEKTEQITNAITKKFCFSVPVLAFTARQFKKIESAIPKDWQNDKEQKTDVLFLWPEYDTKTVVSEAPFVKDIDEVLYVSGALIWRINRKFQSKSYMQKGFIGSDLYKNMTARNVNTVRKIASLL